MKKTNKGFTIIEVVLVLAIAGLIFLIVFLALPALQRSQRDTQRRSDLGRILAAVQSYQSNNSGGFPLTFTTGVASTAAELTTLKNSYMDGNFDDPSTGNQYVLSASPTVSAASQLAVFQAASTTTNANCNSAVAVAGGPKRVFKIYLESGGSTCQLN